MADAAMLMLPSAINVFKNRMSFYTMKPILAKMSCFVGFSYGWKRIPKLAIRISRKHGICKLSDFGKLTIESGKAEGLTQLEFNRK
jgi:hypothetical protein